MLKTVAVSIVNYGLPSLTIKCVALLAKASADNQSICHLDIYIADNYSTDSNAENLLLGLSGYENVTLIRNEKNFGFAGGHNVTLRKIVEQGYDYVWLLNSDCEVSSSALRHHMESVLAETEPALWGSTLLESDGETVQCAGGCSYNPWLSTFRQLGKGRRLDELDKLNVESMDYVSGASMFFATKLLFTMSPPAETQGEVQYLNESYFLYFEELDFVQRLPKNVKLGWCKSAILIHEGGASTDATKGKRSSVAEYHSTLSSLKYTFFYHRNKLLIVYPFRFIAKLVQLSMSGNFSLMKNVMKAYSSFHDWKRKARCLSHN